LPQSVREIHFSHSPDIIFNCDCGAIEKVSCSGETKFDDRNCTNLQELTAFSEFHDYPDPCLIKEGNILINNLNVVVRFQECHICPNSLQNIIARKITFDNCTIVAGNSNKRKRGREEERGRVIPSIANGVLEVHIRQESNPITFTTLPVSLKKISLPDLSYSTSMDEMVRNHNHKMDYTGNDRLTVAIYDEDSDSEEVVVYRNDMQKRRDLYVNAALHRNIPITLANYVQQFLRGSYLQTAPVRKSGAGSQRNKNIIKYKNNVKRKKNKTFKK
jgi:hypothetical protein